MANLIPTYHSVAVFNSITGCSILVNSTTPVSCSSTAPTKVFSLTSGSDMTGDPYNFSPKYPLLLKMFFTDVVMSGTISLTPRYIVNVSGPVSFKCHRTDDKDFGLSLWIKEWDKKSLDTTVSITPLAPLTGVSMNCLTGIASDTMDSPEEL